MALGDYISFDMTGSSTGNPTPQPVVNVKITDNGDGTFTFDVRQVGGSVGDISAFWFDIGNESLIGSLTATALQSPTGTGTPSITLVKGNDNVTNLGNGDTLEGVGYGSDGGFDVGIQVNETPDKIDDYLSFSFKLGDTSPVASLTLADFFNMDFGIRIKSVGPDADGDGDGTDGGSWKILGTGPSFVPNPKLEMDKVVAGVFNADDSADADATADSAGDYIKYEVKVTNTGNVTLTGISVSDPLLTNLAYASGDTDGDEKLDVGETWTYAGSYTVTQDDLDGKGGGDGDIDNTATADSKETAPVSDSEAVPLLYDPEVDFEKFVRVKQDGTWTAWLDADSAPGPIADQNDAIEFMFVVTNTGNVTLTNVQVTDSHFDLNGAASGTGYSFDSLSVGESKEFIYKDATFQFGQHTNTGTVTTGEGATDSDDANYKGIFDGPGVRTPGFWSNLGQQFWDGKAGNETKSGPNFPGGELAPGGYIVLNDDGDGLLEAGELKVNLSDALQFINASQKQQQDARWMLARDAVATQLNFLAGNPNTDSDPSTTDPKQLLAEAVKWLDFYGDDKGANDGVLTVSDLTATAKIAPSSSIWLGAQLGNAFAASVLHTQLDNYNNTGSVFQKQFANDGDALII